jgi:prophage tail gpP-like protein
MSRAHNVISGDTLGAISIKYYGTFQKWQKIVIANPQLQGRKTAIDGSPLIFPGDLLVIPYEDTTTAVASTQQTAETVEVAEGEQDVSIVVDGKKFLGFIGYEINLAYDSFDTFSFSAPYDLALKDIRTACMPFTFKPCAVYYDGALLFKGALLTPDPELTDGEKSITLQGYPVAGILNDCTIPSAKYPGDYAKMNLKEIAETVAESYGVPVSFEDSPGDIFEEVNFEPTETILLFLKKLAQQRGLLFTNKADGGLSFFKSKKEKAFISFEEGKNPLISIKPQFKAQDFFSHVTGFSKTENEDNSLSYTFENKYLTKKGISRCITIMIDDAKTSTDLENGVKAYAGRMFADCVAYELICEGHVNDDGKLFKKGITVCIKAPTAMIIKETNFIARNIKLKKDTEGKTTTMNLVLPGSFLEEIPEALPWEE